jgi:heptosyltransferase-2
MATPFCLVLRELFPDASIDLFCRAYVAEVFRRCSAVDRVIEYGPGKGLMARLRALQRNRPAGGWEIGFILPLSLSSALAAALSGVRRRIGYGGELRGPLLTDVLDGYDDRREHLSARYVRLAERGSGLAACRVPLPVVVAPYRWRESLDAAGLVPPYAVVAPGALYGDAKVWPVDRYAELAKLISQATSMPVVAVGTAAEADLVSRAAASAGASIRNACGELPVAELLALLRGADLVVGNDSGPAHLAAAMGRPTVVLFGPTSPRWTAPRGAAVRIVSHELPCAPCFARRCPEGEPRCLVDIDAREVYEASRTLLEEVRRGKARTVRR